MRETRSSAPSSAAPSCSAAGWRSVHADRPGLKWNCVSPCASGSCSWSCSRRSRCRAERSPAWRRCCADAPGPRSRRRPSLPRGMDGGRRGKGEARARLRWVKTHPMGSLWARRRCRSGHPQREMARGCRRLGQAQRGPTDPSRGVGQALNIRSRGKGAASVGQDPPYGLAMGSPGGAGRATRSARWHAAVVGWAKRSAAQHASRVPRARYFAGSRGAPKPEIAIITAPTTIAESAMLKAGQWCTS